MANETVVSVMGNLTGDPELRYTSAGVAMCRFTVASTPRVFDQKQNTWRDGDPLFMPCTAWRDLAEHVAESLTKGARVVVVGRLRLSRWEDDKGEKRSMMQLDADEVGPSLRFATAKVTKLSRSRADGFTPDVVPDDPWASASTERPASLPQAA
ncbi:single-stranded DNA-binding protein [Dactylosporangium aurantiacum]|uniref:Single-stranded DNA-binding protein n=1 Tax=Dactylosporangium aurantiacum TaxID=35754 RepID=A0A9Q9IIM2_9ACTN|nr:single-stranded DNA-binding protein [Dactylosporangium aurantiacum]MDG6102346.1 single-stranded DNA-binding protein [Dactylosporangium aurantiacum]UWZ53355.1 single-stranded DNA-binding protein [Dactylosporangium aurantiacum]